jgi:uncharacterized protein
VSAPREARIRRQERQGEVHAQARPEHHPLDTPFIVVTLTAMKLEFDPGKNERNITLRGISFEDAARFEWDTAVIIPDDRREYGEPCYRAFGVIDNRLHALVFTPRKEAIRVISLRKANHREVRRYESQTEPAAHR